MDTKALSELDICTKFITPALGKADWDIAQGHCETADDRYAQQIKVGGLPAEPPHE